MPFPIYFRGSRFNTVALPQSQCNCDNSFIVIILFSRTLQLSMLLRISFTSCCAAYRSNNFIVGVTNVSPNVSRPTLWNYTLCGQYPGAVPAGATVSLYCQNDLPPFRYVIVQFPITGNMNFCELEVLVRGMSEILARGSLACSVVYIVQRVNQTTAC